MRMNRLIWLVLPAIALIACGGGSGGGSGGGGDPITKTGIFVDSAVEGLAYICGDLPGTTDSQGTFEYRDDCQVQFKVGDIIIGSAQGADVLTPVELVAGASDETNPYVINIVRFLLTIDADGNASNGISITNDTISAAAGKSVDFEQAIAAFEADGNVQTVVADLTNANGTGKSLVSSTDAQNHLRGSLISFYVGTYEGTFSGDDSGSWTFEVNADGAIGGTAHSNNVIADFDISGSLDSSGSAEVSGTAGEAIFTGTFSRNGNVSGTWSNVLDDESGSFSGARTSIEISVGNGNNGGNGGGSGSNCNGSLSIAGNDVSIIGSTLQVFSTCEKRIWNAISWYSLSSDATPGESILGFNSTVILSYDSNINADVLSLSFFRNDKSFWYALLCEESSADCTGISINETTKTVNFSNVVIEPNQNQQVNQNDATGAITINGTLHYTLGE